MNDQDYLKQAIKLAEQSAEPVKCACVMIKDGRTIAQTFNSQRADGLSMHHAEIKAITAANQELGSRKLTGVTAYCSCEPCAMCLSALSIAQVKRIIYHERMIDVAPNDPLSKLDSAAFVRQYFRTPPQVERLVVS